MFKKDLSIEFCGVKCENPFFLSSSPVDNCYEMCAKALETGWGGVVYKTLGFFIPTDCSPRFDKLDKESTDFIGFKNMEQISEHPLQESLDSLKKLKQNYPTKTIVASIMGQNEKEWEDLARLVTKSDVDIIECNFSCPQMTSNEMGSDVGQNAQLVKKYCQAVSRGTNLPIIAKMTPNIGDMTMPSIAAIKGGASGVTAINTVKCITGIDLDNMVGKPVINGKSAISGYSGKAIKPIALRFLQQLRDNKELKNIEISGSGGVETWRDALEFILLGASNIQVTTSVMQYGYRIVEDMISGLSYFMDDIGIDNLQQLVGKANPNIIPVEDIERNFIIYPKINNDICIGCGRCYVSCFDGAHQALNWDKESRKISLNKDNCVGCHLCSLVCPVQAISKGEIYYRDKNIRDITV
ncbi:NAD-dependent dihydropyrimidine dehydrogenase subunit PreA [Paraclostridium ghonii]|uniref:NAD-dependent dihydropyrimidine dehydrogenase subunit PreA n=1 Tax=Paraclostridium ghonii TaxID=29358 RepID=UPI00202D096B|nr:NAD-dependent dihydropyrimidine dehydrogenase subunit PreA [Paeniclostridium ghonii]MCM0167129.1 NAD-dependent dihydropyrimidine dehydrogenase subunit PreA [Paeniclostridium ghonii]